MRAENRYADTTEIVIRRGRRTVAEADLVAVADGRLIVAEAKCNGSFGDGDEAMACAQGRVKLAEIFDADEIVDRMMIPMIIEAARALEEGIAETPNEVDMGLIMGIGFPP